MSELNFEKVFNELKVIEANAVSREKYNQSQNEVKKLESLLIEANNRFLQKAEELKKLKEVHELQTLEIDVVKAEKQSLEAEKKTLQVRFDEVSLKLKFKTHQYDFLAGQQNNNENKSTNERPQSAEKKTIATQTVKEEPSIGTVNQSSSLPNSTDVVLVMDSMPQPPEKKTIATQTIQVKEEPSIGVVNTASSLPANPRKRPASTHSKSTRSRASELILQLEAKRSKTAYREKIFSCDECLVEWGRYVNDKFPTDKSLMKFINHDDVPNPCERIPMFSSATDLKNHYKQAHGWYRDSEFCGSRDCLHTRGHDFDTSNSRDSYPHGHHICGYTSSNGSKCGHSFRFMDQLEEHEKIIHVNIEFKTREEIFDLFKMIERKYLIVHGRP